MAPALYVIFPELPPGVIISCSLAVVFFNGVLNTLHFRKLKRLPDYRILLPLIAAMAVGGSVGARLALNISPLILKKILAMALLLAAIRVAYHSLKSSKKKMKSPNVWRTAGVVITGASAGLIAGMTGVGGGVIILPALHFIYKIPFPWPALYSNPAVAVGALVACLPFVFKAPVDISAMPLWLYPFQWGHLNLILVAILVLSAWPGRCFGAWLAQRASKSRAEKAFAVFLLLASTSLFLR